MWYVNLTFSICRVWETALDCMWRLFICLTNILIFTLAILDTIAWSCISAFDGQNWPPSQPSGSSGFLDVRCGFRVVSTPVAYYSCSCAFFIWVETDERMRGGKFIIQSSKCPLTTRRSENVLTFCICDPDFLVHNRYKQLVAFYVSIVKIIPMEQKK